MKLHEYFEYNPQIVKDKFCEQLGISKMSLWRILRGSEPNLTLALKITEQTKGKVTLEDLANPLRGRKNKAKSKK